MYIQYIHNKYIKIYNLVWKYHVFRMFSLHDWAIPENIHTPLWTTLTWATKNFRISKKDNCSFCRIPEPADSKA